MWVRFPPGTVWGSCVSQTRASSMSLDVRRLHSRRRTIICQKIIPNIVGFYYKCLLFFTTQCLLYLQAAILQANVRSSKLACLVLFFRDMKSSLTLLLVLTAATAFFVVQPVKASHVVQGGPTYVTVPDAGSTMSLLGFALLGVAALRRKLSR
jgi:hypothetical protein